MRPVRVLLAFALLAGSSSVAHAVDGCMRLSWGACDPQREDQDYSVPKVYTLVESAFGMSAANVGTDTQIRISNPNTFGLALPDAWRFEDAGCQGSSRLTFSNNGFSKVCPAMKGTNATTTTEYSFLDDGTALLRLAIRYDPVTPVVATRYTLWQINVDQTHSNIGPSPPDQSTCGGVERCVNISLEFINLLSPEGAQLSLIPCETGSIGLPCETATWNGGCVIPDAYLECLSPVPALPTTWGRVKSLYR